MISQTGSEIRVAALLIDGAFQLIYQGSALKAQGSLSRRRP